MKMLQPLRSLSVLGFFVMVLMPTAGMAGIKSAATQFGIYVPHNAKDHEAHNDVTVGPCSSNPGDATKVDVKINAGNPPSPSTWTVPLNGHLKIDAGGDGEAGAGRMVGTLYAYQAGNAVYVTYVGFISGWWSYDYSPKVVFPLDEPLIVCIFTE